MPSRAIPEPWLQKYLAERFGTIQKQIGFDVMAEDAMTAVLHNNPEILETYVKDTHILQFVKLVKNNQSGKKEAHFQVIFSSISILR